MGTEEYLFQIYLNLTKRNILKKVKKGGIFALTVPVLLSIRTAHMSFFKEQFSTQDNTPPMPLLDAHLGGFLFL
ncbi:hypothetical protein SAMN04488101_101730 [Pedobacter nyackensis]|uniref:Uncharacterized protein n=1 Tax=Pedobacter nyackensis TaxID=475255 RepID=A0A1W2ALT3_9SPHI|nr:hypothetical protein SAMN04488101_101730 [Pedobacter nyackensis]